MIKSIKYLYIILVISLAISYAVSVKHYIETANKAYATCEEFGLKIKNSEYRVNRKTIKIWCE